MSFFNFVSCDATVSTFSDSQFKEYLNKWGVNQYYCLKRFQFEEPFAKDSIDQFLRDFFNSPVVQSCIQIAGSDAQMIPLVGGSIESVTKKEICAKVVSMDFFDRIKQLELVRESGAIKKCMDEYVDGMQISDELRKMLIMESSDHYDEYSREDRNEFLFHVFERLVVGGSLCQYEDYLQPYLDVARSLYKDLISVQKNPTTKEIQVTSHIWQVEELKGSHALFPQKARIDHSFCYIIVDPLKRSVTYWYLAHLPMW